MPAAREKPRHVIDSESIIRASDDAAWPPGARRKTPVIVREPAEHARAMIGRGASEPRAAGGRCGSRAGGAEPETVPDAPIIDREANDLRGPVEGHHSARLGADGALAWTTTLGRPVSDDREAGTGPGDDGWTGGRWGCGQRLRGGPAQ